MPKNKTGCMYETAVEAAREAIKLCRQEERDKIRKSSFHNMRCLMENYLDLVEHYEKIKYRAKDLEDYLENMDIYGVDPESEDGEIRIEAIKRSKTRTLIIVTQIQSAVAMLKRDMEAKDETEKYRTVTMLYMDQAKRGMKFNQRVNAVADDVKCDPVTIRRWNTEMLNKLAVKLFGIDGLRLDV
ncbi:MAG: hypothetical protein FIA99_08685 [Ruminiclostridium sp.]|nr:hypothetical protein [Ruminiclostridium sp.]